MNASDRTAVLLAGPTASGKSALALVLAQRLNARIINADSMQVYADLAVVSARPSDAEMQGAPHRLYGHVDGAVRYSVGEWLRATRTELAEPGPVIVIGGTGLYFDALLNGLAHIPPIPDAVRERWAHADLPTLRQRMHERDPVAAERLDPSDRQRILRAVEVEDATGKPLSEWQRGAGANNLEGRAAHRILLDPPRDVLRARIAERFEHMWTGGAVDEVQRLLSRELDPSLPVMKAIGVPEIGRFLVGEMTKHEAIERAVIASRQYAKRQRTWFRGRMDDWPRFECGDDALSAFALHDRA